MKNTPFLTDEQLVSLARRGDDSAMAILIARITPAVQARAAVNSVGSSVEFDDLTQEGMLGFLKAVYSFDEEGGASFRTYANTCINNRIVSVLRRQSRGKDIPSPAIVSLDEADFELPASSDDDPQEIISAEESVRQLDDTLSRKLSTMEKKVADLYLSGLSYGDIAVRLGISDKAVDNAIQRMRKKLR
ncbi:MAG: sigma-70 family RNA polymerase sigma factor [Clostridiales bacterium]|nr:sigma-70 family RNA polymerase sigma factor [Clostridiales bacterium]